MRACEVSNADVGDISYKSGQAILYIKGKGRFEKDEFVVLTNDTMSILNTYFQKRGKLSVKAPLFASVSDKSREGKLSPSALSYIFKDIIRNAGINCPTLTLHSTRHTAISLSIVGGADILQAKNLARHGDINTTLTYVHSMNRLENAPEYAIEVVLRGL